MNTTSSEQPDGSTHTRHCVTCGVVLSAGLAGIECLSCWERRMIATEGRLGGGPIADAPTTQPRVTQGPPAQHVQPIYRVCCYCGHTASVWYPLASQDELRRAVTRFYCDACVQLLRAIGCTRGDWRHEGRDHVAMATTALGRTIPARRWQQEVADLLTIYGVWLDDSDAGAA